MIIYRNYYEDYILSCLHIIAKGSPEWHFYFNNSTGDISAGYKGGSSYFAKRPEKL